MRQKKKRKERNTAADGGRERKEEKRSLLLLLLLPSFSLAPSGRLLFGTLELYIMYAMREVHLVRETQHNPAAIGHRACVCV